MILWENHKEQKYISLFTVYHLYPDLFIPMSKAKYLQTITMSKIQ